MEGFDIGICLWSLGSGRDLWCCRIEVLTVQLGVFDGFVEGVAKRSRFITILITRPQFDQLKLRRTLRRVFDEIWVD